MSCMAGLVRNLFRYPESLYKRKERSHVRGGIAAGSETVESSVTRVRRELRWGCIFLAKQSSAHRPNNVAARILKGSFYALIADLGG